MQLHTSSITTVEMTNPETSGTLEQRFALFGCMALLFTLALLMPGMAQPEHYHAFADRRGWQGLPHAADVLSNLGFVLAGLAGWVALARADYQKLNGTARALCALFFTGLLCSGAGSAYYHWAPQDSSLVWDRLGMGLAFAGLLGLAVWVQTSNVLPWVLVQGGGMLILLWLAFVAPRRHALPVELGWVIGLYLVAKLLELSDGDVFDVTAQAVSGHSLKHWMAAAAAWPVLRALKQWRES